MKNANNMNKRILCERKRIVIDRKSLFNQLITMESKKSIFIIEIKGHYPIMR